jgi:hypothetical protein
VRASVPSVRVALPVALAACLVVPAAAAAAPPAVPAAAAGPILAASQEGRLAADGRGVARLTGLGFATGLVRAGSIVVRDRAGDAYVKIGGREVAANRRVRRGIQRITVRGTQRFVVYGSDVVLAVRGRRVALSAAGRYRVQLVGRGSARIDEGPRLGWDGVTRVLGDANRRRR